MIDKYSSLRITHMLSEISKCFCQYLAQSEAFFTGIYLAAGKSGVLISRFPCSLGKSKRSFSLLLNLTIYMLVRYRLNFVTHHPNPTFT